MIVRKHISLLFLFLFFASFCNAQVDRDSIENRLSGQSKADKLNVCTDLSCSLIFVDFDESIEFGQKGINIASSINDSLSLGKLNKCVGEAQYFGGNYDLAATHLYTAIAIFEKLHDKSNLAPAFNAIAKLYRKTRDLDRAEDYYNKAMDLFIDLNDTAGIEMIWNESGVVFEYRGDYQEALNRYNRALAIAKQSNNKIGVGYALNNISGSYLLMGQYAEAEKTLLQALALRKELGDTFALVINYSDLGAVYDSLKKYELAKAYIDTSNQIISILPYPELLSHNYEMLSYIARKQGDNNAAYTYYVQADKLRDSLFAVQKIAQVEELDAKYQTEKKQQKIELQELEISRKNYIILSAVILILMSSMLGYSFYRRNKIKQKQKLQEAVMLQQKIATQSVLDAEEKERQRIGQDLHDGVGQMMSAVKINLSTYKDKLSFPDEQDRLVYDNIMSLVDESCKEVRTISHNMMPNALLRSGLASAVRDFLNKLHNSVIEVNLYTDGLNERLSNNVETILYRVIQESVNNVIKHAEADRLDISLIKDEGNISVTIEDNGKGFDVSKKSVFKGIGLKNIISRVEYLKGTVDFDSRQGHGTVVNIIVPYN